MGGDPPWDEQPWLVSSVFQAATSRDGLFLRFQVWRQVTNLSWGCARKRRGREIKLKYVNEGMILCTKKPGNWNREECSTESTEWSTVQWNRMLLLQNCLVCLRRWVFWVKIQVTLLSYKRENDISVQVSCHTAHFLRSGRRWRGGKCNSCSSVCVHVSPCVRGSVRGCVRACVGACIDLFLLSILCLSLSHSFSQYTSVERSGYLRLSVHVPLFYLFIFFSNTKQLFVSRECLRQKESRMN